MGGDGEDEDDYLSMSFTEQPATPKETSLQRTTRLKKEAAERGRVLSKKELAEKERTQREAALATQLDASNKGAKMMAMMGFKGGALGKSGDARTQPIELLIKNDRGGIGMDSEKKRKVRETAEAMQGLEKKRKVDEAGFRERSRNEREERRAEGMMWSAMRTLEAFETAAPGDEEAGEASRDTHDEKLPPVKSINVLWRPVVKQRQDRDRERRMRYDLDQSLSRKPDYDDLNAETEDRLGFSDEVQETVEDDPELEAFESLTFAERLARVVEFLREKYHYCFWCKYRYPDADMEGCPGLTEDEHG
ncbi:hypothetical protein BAUCODRAFT_527737 [Baudoinia panamericana UAMH 10762]|uniref:G-patch domain-containing protein n=1 Tax=Baudoinia panamericana (strain UAMH 10762) TaxID=717646 RepID=M2N8J6_BAUPA|nr:uncharacterized protein BAUCODRAFT_527737 [Baudoinia panamericana UAMH 10762]EMC95155.1 hypothetical protein BAUCODRAFT_527737 [Baudoinia panamericana UAMH 10762]